MFCLSLWFILICIWKGETQVAQSGLTVNKDTDSQTQRKGGFTLEPEEKTMKNCSERLDTTKSNVKNQNDLDPITDSERNVSEDHHLIV